MKILFYLPIILISFTGFGQKGKAIFSSKAYTILNDRVLQGDYVAVAKSSREITSNYRSPANLYKSPLIDFKFSINGKDNEMTPNTNHHYIVTSAEGMTPIIEFGKKDTGTFIAPSGTYLMPNSKITIRLDMRNVLKAFDSNGYFITYNGDKIYKNDFKGVFVAGNASPMIWDFNNVINYPELELKDKNGSGIYETTLILNKPSDEKTTASAWRQTKDLSAFPIYNSTYKISDALYNLSLEEMERAIEPDSTFRTGKEWGGVWTRDISYSIILAMAVLEPKVAIYSLMRKVKNGVVIQDTGTGGAYPISTDRMIWAVAAFEVYKVTGDKEWLRKAFDIIKKSAEDDFHNAYDTNTGLVRGESSFLDWREETYPRWMQPADIYESECLGTNAVHFKVNVVLAEMASILHESTFKNDYEKRAEKIKAGLNNYLWINSKGYFGQYLYGRLHRQVSPRSEALGEALTILFDATNLERQQSIITKTPIDTFGIPCIYPEIPNILPYHNNAVWPFVETFWALASAKVGNEQSLVNAIAAIYRPAALFLTNKENMVATDGDFAGTQINSSNMLWSLSGNLALVYKIFFGMNYQPDGLVFSPFVPHSFEGNRSLKNFKYRDAIIEIYLEGYGNKINKFYLDGVPQIKPVLPSSIKGNHTIRIVLSNASTSGSVNLQPIYFTPETPVITYSDSKLKWDPIKGASKYIIFKDANVVSTVTGNNYPISANYTGEYQVAALDINNIASFCSEPISVFSKNNTVIKEMESIMPVSMKTYSGYSGKGFIEISKTENRSLPIEIKVATDGKYAIDFRYANGNGPINTENKCAFRELIIDNQPGKTVVFPQRGKGEWSDWGYSNPVVINLKQGVHKLLLKFTDHTENMNGEINEAMLDYMRVVKIK